MEPVRDDVWTESHGIHGGKIADFCCLVCDFCCRTGARNRTSNFGVAPVDGIVMNVLVVDIGI